MSVKRNKSSKAEGDKPPKHKQAKAVIRAQKALVRLQGERIRRKKDATKVIRQVKKLVAKLPGTFVEAQANKFVAELEDRAKTLR